MGMLEFLSYADRSKHGPCILTYLDKQASIPWLK